MAKSAVPAAAATASAAVKEKATVTDINEAKDKAKKVAAAATEGNMKGLAPLPPMPRARKSKPPKPCGCGCGAMTRGGDWVSGHDSYIKGWAIRVDRGIVKLKDVPDAQQAAVKKTVLELRKAAKEKAAAPVEAVSGQPEGGDDTEQEGEEDGANAEPE